MNVLGKEIDNTLYNNNNDNENAGKTIYVCIADSCSQQPSNKNKIIIP